MKLKDHEVEALRNAPGSIADGGETNPVHWELEKLGLIRPVFSYNPAHYVRTHGYDFTEPVYAYALTELGATWLAVLTGK